MGLLGTGDKLASIIGAVVGTASLIVGLRASRRPASTGDGSASTTESPLYRVRQRHRLPWFVIGAFLLVAGWVALVAAFVIPNQRVAVVVAVLSVIAIIGGLGSLYSAPRPVTLTAAVLPVSGVHITIDVSQQLWPRNTRTGSHQAGTD